MRDISARELKGHNILAVERFQDNTRWMIEFSVLRPSTAYGSPGEEIRLFLTEDGYQAALQSQQRREIKIKRYARVIEGTYPRFQTGKTPPPLINKSLLRKERIEMCTVKEIREAIWEDCHSQHGMEFIEIDRVLQTLPFSQGNDLLDRPPIPKRPYRRRKK